MKVIIQPCAVQAQKDVYAGDGDALVAVAMVRRQCARRRDSRAAESLFVRLEFQF
jgi:hypothetical protein